ncbi:exosortase [Novimethylophilus kurashikiensis]|uniref:Exosortase n=1 Tax=Novimethylophilus kurashikiensis TaxID=1825523 RepID=A0A2R5F9T1_9PROT|nr:exosortase B [Novimethylophilus kurashikiensis]GBG14992.1 exosortase [Novimethylophilus kurashikiensis]
MSQQESTLPLLVRNTLPRPWLLWLPVVIGLAAICIPSFIHLAQTTWDSEENGHGPIILMVFIWLVWQQRSVLASGVPRPGSIMGWLSLLFGLAAFVIGRSQSIDTLEVAGLIPMLVGIVLLMRGWQTLRMLWFPLLFLLFMIPLPGLLITVITGALKTQVSSVAENLLYYGGLPIARNGVVLSIGPYQLLVADACSGLNSMFSLSALGLLYLYLMRYRNWLHIGLMLAAILPIAFIANVIRVMVLVLITYQFGDEAGQGFAHSAAGMLLFAVALLLLLGFDKLLRSTLFRRRSAA